MEEFNMMEDNKFLWKFTLEYDDDTKKCRYSFGGPFYTNESSLDNCLKDLSDHLLGIAETWGDPLDLIEYFENIDKRFYRDGKINDQ